MTTKRRLTAIMFTDIEGYTALMQDSEAKAIEFRSKHREVFNRETEQYQGKIIQYYGDGTLSVFDSAVNAVKCGVAIQKAMQQDPKVPVRIGIHSGDIVYDHEDIIGDGVNVASRIESLAIPGSVLISDKVYDEIKNHHSIQTRFLDKYPLKNVQQPVGVYAITNNSLSIPDPLSVRGKLDQKSYEAPKSLKPVLWFAILGIILLILGFWIGGHWIDGSPIELTRVAVIPLTTNIDSEDDYFQSGMTQGLIRELSKINSVMVIDQKSTFSYASIANPVQLLSNDLPQLNYVINGTASRELNTVEVQLSLFSSRLNKEIWNNSYQTDIAEIRNLWVNVASDLIEPMGLDPGIGQTLAWTGATPVKPETYELYLKGTHHINKSNPMDWQTGLTYLQQAVDNNPADAYAYAALAEGYVLIGHGPDPPTDVFPKAHQAALRAIRLDSTLADGWAALAHYETYFGWNWERAEQAFKKANTLNPNLAMNHYHRSWYLLLFGKVEEAVEAHLLAKRLDPFSPLITANTGLLYLWIGEPEKALQEVEESLAVPGFDNFAWGLGTKATVYAAMGKFPESLELFEQAAAVFPAWRYLGYGPTLIQSGNIEEGKKLIAELESRPASPYSALCLGFMYCALGDTDKAIESLSYPEKHGWYPWIRVWPGLDPLHDHPEYLALLEEMNLGGPLILRELNVSSTQAMIP